MASISTIPPELLLDILSITVTSSLFTQPLIVHGQFSQLPSMCRTCCYRQIAGVCSTWAQIVRQEFMARETVFGVYGSEKDEEVLTYVTKDQGKASGVKKVDASLRCWQGWKSLPPVASFDTTTEEDGEETTGFLQTREVQLEKQRQQVLSRYVARSPSLLSRSRDAHDLDSSIEIVKDSFDSSRLVDRSKISTSTSASTALFLIFLRSSQRLSDALPCETAMRKKLST